MAEIPRSDQWAHLDEPVRRVLSAACRDLPPDASPADAIRRVDAAVDILKGYRAAAASAPGADEVETACDALRSAAAAQAEAERVADALAADRIQFLETSLEFHDRHGAQPCPVCAASTLDDEWVVRARAALTAEKDAAGALRVARSAAHRARQTVTALVRAVQAPPTQDAGLPGVDEARAAHQVFTAPGANDDVARAEQVAAALPRLRQAYGALGRAAEAQLGAAHQAQTWLRSVAGEG
ncbi:hypothetical protein H7K45_12965 [Mycobacterium yunnanensis]|uniref:Uncharacterized protein n=1 Tax=Mycobacterium yunnanensis TaxID=368477 RepID=A0A9X2Z238_9MYCO|nr:hypothetical protein [Mycobacterium yunnanensis]MCV7421456.1 hypothetical protein [Mycobacterium yunnanensis]